MKRWSVNLLLPSTPAEWWFSKCGPQTISIGIIWEHVEMQSLPDQLMAPQGEASVIQLHSPLCESLMQSGFMTMAPFLFPPHL